MKKKILVADDDEGFVEILCERLNSKGYQTLSAQEGIAVVELAAREKPDLILLDWQMPYGKGSAVLQMLAEKQETSSIPVIVVTGYDEPGMKKWAFSLGARDFIRKPYEPKELLDKIQGILA